MSGTDESGAAGGAAQPWTALRVRPSAAAARDGVTAALFAAGSQGVWEDGDDVVSHFETPLEAEAAADAVRAADPVAAIALAAVPPVDWSEAWKAHVRVFEVGALRVAPPWLAEGLDPDTTIVIEPGMAFGTGDHPSTRGALRLLADVVRPGDVVADLGAGSAVLAIAAVKLGASRAAAVELDPEAIGNAEENVVRNGVAGRVTVIEGDANLLLPLLAPVRVILANIISSVVTELLPAMRAALAPDGRVIVSGILVRERADIGDVLEALDWHVERECEEEGWWSAVIRPA